MLPSERTTSAPERAFQLRVERAYLQLLGLVLADSPKALPQLQGQQASNEEELTRLAGHEPMTQLATRLQLAPWQVDFMWACAALTCDPRMVPHAEALDGPVGRRGLTPALYARMARLDTHRGRALAVWLSQRNPLVDNGLLVVADEHLLASARPYLVPSRVLSHLAGRDAPEPPIERVPKVDAQELLHDDEQKRALAELARALSGNRRLVIAVEGLTGSGRRTALATAADRPLATIRARHDNVAQQEHALQILRREVVLSDAVPVLAGLELHSDPSIAIGMRRSLERWIASMDGPVCITTATWNLDLDLEQPLIRVRWPIAEPDTRRNQWQQIAGALTGDVDGLVMRYRMGPGGMRRAIASARTSVASAALPVEAVEDGIRHNMAERLGGLAQRIDVHQTWSDLVLADDIFDQLSGVLARVRHKYKVLHSWGYRSKIGRGQGVPVLFSGPPGTGKTMVAGLIAKDLGLDLYQVDLSQVVSKWVGESEKQLSKVFEAAEEGHALILFDEADSLFGQRSQEMRGATDRYANMEVNYLLQRIEAFGGIVILTSNLDNSIDKAFKRRLAGHVVFAAPDDEERERLWRTLTSTGTAPVALDADFAELARAFPTMTGANIRNSVLAAAFLAAAADSGSITLEHLMRAARAEYRSMGHVLSDRPLNSPSRRPGIAHS